MVITHKTKVFALCSLYAITIKKVCEIHADCGFGEIQNSASTSNTKTIVLLHLLAEVDERFFVL